MKVDISNGHHYFLQLAIQLTFSRVNYQFKKCVRIALGVMCLEFGKFSRESTELQTDIFSTSLCMYCGFLCIVFCLSACNLTKIQTRQKVTRHYISGTIWLIVTKFGNDVTSCDVTEWRQDVSWRHRRQWRHRMTSNNKGMAKTNMTYTRAVRQCWGVFICSCAHFSIKWLNSMSWSVMTCHWKWPC